MYSYWPLLCVFIFADVQRKVTVMNELLALSLLISSMKDMYNMGSLYLLNPMNDMIFSNESDRMTTFLLTVILHKHDKDDF
jgi:hypothetical protein